MGDGGVSTSSQHTTSSSSTVGVTVGNITFGAQGAGGSSGGFLSGSGSLMTIAVIGALAIAGFFFLKKKA